MASFCPVLHSNAGCACEEGDCAKFEEFGMCCDRCMEAGHRDADSWFRLANGEIWCSACVQKFAYQARAIGVL